MRPAILQRTVACQQAHLRPTYTNCSHATNMERYAQQPPQKPSQKTESAPHPTLCLKLSKTRSWHNQRDAAALSTSTLECKHTTVHFKQINCSPPAEMPQSADGQAAHWQHQTLTQRKCTNLLGTL
jgi:hypothetical protein